MRTFKDRLRHTLMFEGIALFLVAIIGSWITGKSIETIGALGLMFSALAMVWNFVFNWMFDHWEQRYRAGQERSVKLRISHAVLFEAFFLTFGVFLVVWWLEISFVEALILDIGMSAFFLIYTFGFNWAYDLIFPIPSVETY
ncbi:PACE efflux transporter [Terasakiella sp. SH-1]|uniref:PACE efflux transporter n=1 Tax=Terasakiella sp. SH-1 TaxID=2560057 RepID=UPI0010737767|nr:PACE efflux transporter [Terasakiella sp. SH-1]